ncbi:hypothetical protein HRbin02_00962 [Candidatus Calditenuaceae archaeon HR02]|nr:hypothetical protein HRbin02_00962 [Candidatus Calditenuaceae archaeon HR02]
MNSKTVKSIKEIATTMALIHNILLENREGAATLDSAKDRVYESSLPCIA